MFGRYLKSATFNKVKSVIGRTPISNLNRSLCLSKNVCRLSANANASSYSCLHATVVERLCSKRLVAPLPFSHIIQTRNRSSQSESVQNDTESYTELYLINNIRFYRLLCRFSRYSLITFLFGSPLCIASSYLDIYSVEILRIIFSCLTFYMTVFIGQSFLFSSRIVAKIMISPDRDTVKISHLTLFGNRKDIYLKPSDIVKFDSFGGELMSKNMVVLKFRKPSKKLIFLPGQGGIDTNYHALELLLCSGSKE